MGGLEGPGPCDMVAHVIPDTRENSLPGFRLDTFSVLHACKTMCPGLRRGAAGQRSHPRAKGWGESMLCGRALVVAANPPHSPVAGACPRAGAAHLREHGAVQLHRQQPAALAQLQALQRLRGRQGVQHAASRGDHSERTAVGQGRAGGAGGSSVRGIPRYIAAPESRVPACLAAQLGVSQRLAVAQLEHPQLGAACREGAGVRRL